MRQLICLITLTALLAGAACSPTPASPASPAAVATPSATATIPPTEPPPAFAPGECPFEAPAGLKITCGFVEAPEDRSAAAPNLIRLAVAIVHSSAAQPAPDPIIFLNGGPGVPTVESAVQIADEWAPLLSKRDLILFDQRGVGLSQPALDCPELPPLRRELIQQALPAAEADARLDQDFEACLQRLQAAGIALGAYNLSESAADVRDLRRALGLEQVNLYGVSYGTFLAQAIIAHYQAEGWIRSAVLDSAGPLWLSLSAEFLSGAQAAFHYLFRRCAEDAACQTRYPDLEALYLEASAQLTQAPLRVPVTDPISQERLTVVVDNMVFTQVIFGALYYRQAIPRLPKLIERTHAGFTDDLASRDSPFLQNYLAQIHLSNIGLSLSLACSDREGLSPAEPPPDEIYPDLRALLARNWATWRPICQRWGPAATDLTQLGPFPSAVPALILAGEFDPITPPFSARRLADQWENAAYLLFPATGHNVLMSGGKVTACSQAVMAAFLAAPQQAPDSDCLADIQPPGFVIGH